MLFSTYNEYITCWTRAAVTELMQGELLHFERNVFLCGAPKSAPDLIVEPGAVTYWTCGQGTGLDRMRGNIGGVIFRVPPTSSSQLHTNCAYLLIVPGYARVGILSYLWITGFYHICLDYF